MEYIKFNNGVDMPMVGFGTWDVRGTSGEETIIQALNVGYRLIDTAKMYDNEEMIGRAIRKSNVERSEIFITSKLHRPYTDSKRAMQGIEMSLEYLQTDYIDLMLIHEPYDNAIEMYQALQKAYQEGKVRAIGISNYDVIKYHNFIDKCAMIPVLNQVESHVYFPQFALKKSMEINGTHMQAWGSFTEGRRNIFAEPVLNEIGHVHGKTSGQVALRYLVQNGISVIPKSSKLERMKENIDIFDFELTEQECEIIAALDEGQSLFGWY